MAVQQSDTDSTDLGPVNTFMFDSQHYRLSAARRLIRERAVMASDGKRTTCSDGLLSLLLKIEQMLELKEQVDQVD